MVPCSAWMRYSLSAPTTSGRSNCSMMWKRSLRTSSIACCRRLLKSKCWSLSELNVRKAVIICKPHQRCLLIRPIANLLKIKPKYSETTCISGSLQVAFLPPNFISNTLERSFKSVSKMDAIWFTKPKYKSTERKSQLRMLTVLTKYMKVNFSNKATKPKRTHTAAIVSSKMIMPRVLEYRSKNRRFNPGHELENTSEVNIAMSPRQNRRAAYETLAKTNP
mmetsp:Transcript_62671/g.162641  ORF Transcript_62671/g.162641 Transcript_62671/m.162641 type:complete len:221 (-) Transcript_62671:689-1351(-)